VDPGARAPVAAVTRWVNETGDVGDNRNDGTTTKVRQKPALTASRCWKKYAKPWESAQ